MYGKFFESAFTGSMMGAGADAFALLGYIIANTKKSHVELNPRFLSAVIGMPEENVMRAIEFLSTPDPKSRNPEHEGRRIVHEAGFQYLVPSWRHYHDILNEDDRRDYNRQKQRECRERKRQHKFVPAPGGENGGLTALPETFPTIKRAIEIGESVGCSQELVEKIWRQSAARGGKDSKGVVITDWENYLRVSQQYDEDRRAKLASGNGRPSTVNELRFQIQTVQDVISAHVANRESINHNPKCSDAEKADLRLQKKRLQDLQQQVANAGTK